MFAHPGVCPIGANHIFSINDLPALNGLGELAILITGELSVKPIFGLVAVLLWQRISAGKFLDGNSNGVRIRIINLRLVDGKRLGDNRALDSQCVLGKLVDCVDESLLDASFVDD